MAIQLTKTRAQLVNAALGKLMLLGADGFAEAEDYERVNEKVDGLILQLSTDEICEIADEDKIPAEWLDDLAALLANVSANSFGKPYSEDAKRLFERHLISMNSSRPTYETLKADYF